MEIGREIKLERERRGLSQKQLGAKINVSQPKISRFETGLQHPSRLEIVKLAAALDSLSLKTAYCRRCIVLQADMHVLGLGGAQDLETYLIDQIVAEVGGLQSEIRRMREVENAEARGDIAARIEEVDRAVSILRILVRA